MKKLYRSNNDRLLAGVIGGLGEYFDVDPVLLRIFWIFILVFTGLIPGIIVYSLAAFLMPRKSTSQGIAPTVMRMPSGEDMKNHT